MAGVAQSFNDMQVRGPADELLESERSIDSPLLADQNGSEHTRSVPGLSRSCDGNGDYLERILLHGLAEAIAAFVRYQFDRVSRSRNGNSNSSFSAYDSALE